MLTKEDLKKYSREDIELLLIIERGFLYGKRHYRCRACHSETKVCFGPYGETRKRVRCLACGKTTRVKNLNPRSKESKRAFRQEIAVILEYLKPP
jgi:hypothetical protein